jgi:DHA1 family multidrug resistance protein-like MFS transporter
MASKPDSSTSTSDDSLPPISWKRNLYALWIAQLLAIIGFNLRDSFLPFFLKDLTGDDLNKTTLWSGLVLAGGAGVMIFAQPIWGILADRKGRRPMVMRAMFAAMITVFLTGLAQAPWQILGLRMIEGAFTGTVAACTALVATSAPREKLGYALGMIQTAVFAGSSFGPFLGGILAAQLGFRPTFFIASVFLGVGGLIVLFTVQERFTPAPKGELRGFAALRASRDWLLASTMVLMMIVLFVSRFAQQASRPITPLFIAELGDLTDSRAASVTGLAYGLLGVTSAMSSILLGQRSDRIGHERVLIVSTVISGLVFLPMALITAPWQMVVLQALFGIGAGGLIPAANAIIANRTPPERRGAIFGVTASIGSLGSFLGPLAGAAIATFVGFPATFLFTGVMLLGLAAFVIWEFSRMPEPAGEAVLSKTHGD